MEIDLDEYVAGFRPDLMEVLAAWARGVTFAELVKMSTVFEVGRGRGQGQGVRFSGKGRCHG